MKKIIFISIFFIFSVHFFAQKTNEKNLFLIYKVNKNGKLPIKKNPLAFKDSVELYAKLISIKQLLFNKGYIAASIDSVVQIDSLNYNAYLFLGEKYYWNLKTDSITATALKSANIHRNTFLYKRVQIADYLKKRDKLLEYYDNKGFPFAELSIDSITIRQNFIQGRWLIKKNQKFYFDTIYIKGKLKVAPKFIYQTIGIKPGDVFSGELLREVDKNIERLSYISLLKPSELEFYQENADLYLYLKKKKSNFFSGILGFANNEQNNQLKLTGNIRLDLNNSFGIGENIAFQWESYADSSQYLFTKINFPYLFFLPLGFSTNFELDKTVLDYLNMNYSFSLAYHFTPGNGINVFYRRKQSFLINNVENKDFAGTDNSLWGMKIGVDNTNRLLLPNRGYRIALSSAYGNRIVEGADKEQVFDVRFDAAYYRFFNKYFNILFKNVSSGIFNNSGFYENELFKLGGIQSVRGFDEKSLLASAYTVFTLEPRFFIGSYSFLSVFTDYVYFRTEGVEQQTNNMGIGLGAGFNIDSKAGIFSINFALGSLNKQAFRFSNTKVHIAYVARF